MTTSKKQDKSFVPGKTGPEKADDKKKSFEQGIQNNNTTDETEINPLADKKKEKGVQDDNSEPVEERSGKLNQ